MRKQFSAIRVAYNMLRESEKEKTKKTHTQIYQRLRQLFPELPTRYIDSAIYKAKQYSADEPVVFGGKRLFEKLCKNHLTGKVELRNGEAYESVSFEIPTPKVKYIKENGVIAIDTNTSPIHLAIAEVSRAGKLVSYQTISLQEWILAHQMVDLAIQKSKAIAVENLKKLKKEANPAYTSIIGMLKYAPQLSIDKDIAGAYVELRSVGDAKKLLTNLIQSLQSGSNGCEGANGRNPELASSACSPPLSYPWTNSIKGLVPSKASVGGRGVG